MCFTSAGHKLNKKKKVMNLRFTTSVFCIVVTTALLEERPKLFLCIQELDTINVKRIVRHFRKQAQSQSCQEFDDKINTLMSVR